MKYVTALFFFLALALDGAQGQAPATGKVVVFRQVNVIPMDRERVLENQTVVVQDGKITAVTDAAKARYSKNATVVEAKGKYLMPGLAEMHAHVPPVDDLEPMKEVLLLFAANGITTIRGMLGHPRHLELRSKIRSGEILGPHFYTTGPSFSGQTVKNPEQAAAMVRAQKQAGYDYLKLHPGLSRANFDAMAQAAKAAGIPFVGHVSFDVGIWHAIAAGYSSIDHLDGFIEGLVPGIEKMDAQQAGLFGMFVADKADTRQIPKLMQGLKAANTWVVPTQALAERWFAPVPPEHFQQDPGMAYMSPEVRRNWENSKRSLQANPRYQATKIKDYIALRRQLILACQQNGVGLLLGCDAPQVFNVPGFSTHQELQYLVAAGLTPFQALQTGTVNVAAYLNQSATSGTIKPGAVSDLILLAGNPLQDIAHTQQIEGVMLGSRWMPKAYLQQELKKLVKD
jgi:imidazolonepropionase-like amidohydrolase